MERVGTPRPGWVYTTLHRVGDGTHNLAILRQLSLNLLRQAPTLRGSLATKRLRAALDDTYLRRLLAGLDRLPSDQTASTT